jgi:hypothetical protein
MLAAYRADGNSGDLPAALTFDQWGYYYQRAAGVYGPAIESVMPGAARDALIDFATWQTATQLAGLGVRFVG